MAILLLLSAAVSNAQIKNATTETVKISGNCGMCKTAIEKVGRIRRRCESRLEQGYQYGYPNL